MVLDVWWWVVLEGQRMGRGEIGGDPFPTPLHPLALSYSAFSGSEQKNSAYILDQVEIVWLTCFETHLSRQEM